MSERDLQFNDMIDSLETPSDKIYFQKKLNSESEAQFSNRIDSLESKLDLVISLIQSSAMSDGSDNSCPYTFYQWLDEWYLTYKAPHLKASSLYQIRNCIKNHIKQNINDVPLNKLMALDVEKALNSIKTSRMKKYTRDTIGDCLRQAYKLDLTTVNIMAKVRGICHMRKKGRSLSKKEEANFIKMIKNNALEDLYLFYLMSGCRKSEALNIKWEHIDYNNERIFIDGTKTTCAKRFIPLFDDIKTLLRRIEITSEYIFPVSTYTLESNFRWMKKKYRLNYSIHSLRHTFSTRHYENGVKPKTIQKWMGHSRVEFTQDIYTDVLTEFENEEIKKANKTRKLIGFSTI